MAALEAVRYQIDEILKAGTQNIRASDFTTESYKIPSNYPNTGAEEQPTLLQEAVNKIVTQMSQTIPGVEELLKACNWQLGQFIFFMHFVLRCLHRTDEVKPNRTEEGKPGGDWPEWMEAPFCQDRRRVSMTPGVHGPITEARLELERLIEHRMGLGALEGLRNDKIPGFRLRDPLLITGEIQEKTAQ